MLRMGRKLDHIKCLIKTTKDRDFPGSSVVETLCFKCRGHGFNPWSGTEIPHAARRGQKQGEKNPAKDRKGMEDKNRYKERSNKQKAVANIIDINQKNQQSFRMSMVLSIPITKQIMSDWIKKQYLTICCLKSPLQVQRHIQLFLSIHGALVPCPLRTPWIPKSAHAQFPYIKWCSTVSPLYPWMQNLWIQTPSVQIKSTGIPCFIVLCCIVLCRYYKLKVCGNLHQASLSAPFFQQHLFTS